MEDFNLITVATKSIKGVFALASRTFFVTILSIVTQLVLTIFLDPSSYGVFYVVSAIVLILTYFQDIGLAGSLIQKKTEPTIEELQTVFTLQQCLVLLLIIPGYIFSGYVVHFYHLNQAGDFLFKALLFSLFLSSLKTIPTILLERNLRFEKLVIPQIAESIVYNTSLIICAINGWGITSFTIAIILREIIGLIIIYIIQPWPIGISIRVNRLRSLLSFGVPFQINSILALIKDNLVALYIGKALSFGEVGYIAFSQKLAFLPLRFIMDHVIKITFPSFSRLQHDKEGLRKIIEKSLFIISLLIFPIVVVLSMYASDIIHYIPIPHYQQKWNPQFLWISIIFFSLNALFASITVPLTNFLNAVGKVKTTLIIMVMLTCLTWVLTPLGIVLFGYNGVSIASFITAASAIVVVYIVKKHVPFSFVKSIFGPLLASIGMVCFGIITKHAITSFFTLVPIILLGMILYAGLVLILQRKELIQTTKFVLSTIQH